ncbi:MAG TPA: PDZ domain-containing protein [Gemmatimonadales bacterium]|nr:PDZ domain-containing protein [Gemmatimonadales bacterium]
MIRKWTIAALAVCTLWPAAATAQEPAPRASTRPRVRVEAGPYAFAFSDNRGRIGVIVDTRANATGDKIGARIEGVTPGGPAEKAGIKVGDVITRFNGTALGGATAQEEQDSGPGMKLIDLARELDPGDTVQVEYRRGNESRKATMVAEDLGGGGFWGGPGARRWDMMDPEDFPGRFFRSPWGGMELVKLNPELGEYFGTREGVLVVSAPRDSALALKGGDVITGIGGRKPSSPEQAMRILRSYDPGDTVSIDVFRKQKRVTVKWSVPEEEDHFYRMMPRTPREEPSWFRLMPRMRREIQIPKIEIRDVIRMRAI